MASGIDSHSTERQQIIRRDAAKAVSVFTLLLNTVLYGVIIGLSSWALNRAFDFGQQVTSRISSTASILSIAPFEAGNAVTPFFALVCLISSMVGIASILLGVQHVISWGSKTLASANSAAMIAWVLSLFAMGLACKEIHTGGPHRHHRLRILEALAILLPWVLLLQLSALHASIMMSSNLKHAPRSPITTPRSTV